MCGEEVHVEGCELWAIDEAQSIPNVATGLKIIADQVLGIRGIVTGPSSFESVGQVGEPLAGRKRTLTRYPIAQSELLFHHNRYELQQKRDELLVFGTYPEVVLSPTRREGIETITEIATHIC